MKSLQRYLIFLSVIAVGFFAWVDASQRLKELSEISAVTPVQVEMKQDPPKSFGEGIQNKVETIEKTPKIQEPKPQTKLPVQKQNLNVNPFDTNTTTRP